MEKEITERKLSLFCLDKDNERHYLANITQKMTEQGVIVVPILSLKSEEAFGFNTVEMATRYSEFLSQKINKSFFYCILPEDLITEEKNDNEE